MAPSAATTRSGDSAPARSVTPRATATVTGTSPGSASGASSATQTPSAQSGSSRRATSSPSRVLPMPPAPISVTSRWIPSSSVTSVSAAARPISSEVGAGRFVGDGASGSAATAADRRSAAGLGAGSPPTGPATVARSGRLDRERRISWYSWLVSASGDVRSSRFSASTQSWYWRSAASRRPRRA